MTYAQIKALVYDILGDSSTSPRLFSSTMIDVFANMALNSMNEYRVMEKRYPIYVVADTALYDLPTKCRQVERVTYDGIVIYPLTTGFLNMHNDTWRELTGPPIAYWLENNQIGLYPKPTVAGNLSVIADSEYGVLVTSADSEYGVVVDTSTNDGLDFTQEEGVLLSELGSKNLEVFYWAAPEDVDVAAPEIPLWAHYGMIWGILSLCYAADTYDQDYAKSDAYRVLFDDVVRRVGIRASSVSPKVQTQKTFSGRSALDLLSDRTRRTIVVPGS